MPFVPIIQICDDISQVYPDKAVKGVKHSSQMYSGGDSKVLLG
jgi:hypothetical protein